MDRIARAFRFLLSLVIVLVARLLLLFIRKRVTRTEPHPDGPVIFAFRHGDQLALLPYPRSRPTASIVSLSRDGDLQSQILARLGLVVIRGSSSAGGAAALASSLRWLRQGYDLALAVDGPRGPAGQSKPGVIWLSERAHAPIVAVACSATGSHRVRGSWDSFLIPLPMSRLFIASAPVYRPWEDDETDGDKLAHLDSLIEQTEASCREACRSGGIVHPHPRNRGSRGA